MKLISFTLILLSYAWQVHAQPTIDMLQTQSTLVTEEGTWRYVTQGSGDKAVLFIHGASSSRQIWRHQYAMQFAGHRLIFVDLLGYGQSDKSTVLYGLENWIEGLHGIVKQEGIKQLTLVGHSNGAILAKEYYRAYPDKVKQLLLLDGMLRPMIHPQVLAWMHATLKRSDYTEYMAEQIKNMPLGGLSEEDAAILQADASKAPRIVTEAELEMVSDSATWAPLTISCPVHIIHSNNPQWTDDYLSWLSEIAPQLTLETWHEAGHFIPMQYPEKFNQYLENLILTKK